MQVILHGGAGGVPDDPAPRQAVLDGAARLGVGVGRAVAAGRPAADELPDLRAAAGLPVRGDGDGPGDGADAGDAGGGDAGGSDADAGGDGGAGPTPGGDRAGADAAGTAPLAPTAGFDAGHGHAPLAAVEAALRELERSPRFNAGVGSARQSDGGVRTDAGAMTGSRRVGAVCSAPDLAHAVSAARVVLAETPHVLVAGDRAVELAGAFGVGTADLLTDDTRGRWAGDRGPPADAGPREHLGWIRSRFGDGGGGDPLPGGRTDDGGSGAPGGDGGTEDAGDDDEADAGDDGTAGGEGARDDGDAGDAADGDPRDHDTVGAVARHGDRFAAATSTGGRWYALAGRVGDVPQVGAGFYCSPLGGASATGAGEDIARVTLSRRAVELLADRDAATAADRAIEEFGDLVEGSAGVIVCGHGGVGAAHDAAGMQTAVAGDGGGDADGDEDGA